VRVLEAGGCDQFVPVDGRVVSALMGNPSVGLLPRQPVEPNKVPQLHTIRRQAEGDVSFDG
jgi:hypothetical protein